MTSSLSTAAGCGARGFLSSGGDRDFSHNKSADRGDIAVYLVESAPIPFDEGCESAATDMEITGRAPWHDSCVAEREWDRPGPPRRRNSTLAHLWRN